MDTFFNDNNCKKNPKGNSYTHFTSFNSKEWSVYQNSYEELYIKYCTIRNESRMDICEFVTSNLVPIIFEFDLPFHNIDEQPYEEDFRYQLIHVCQNVLTDILQMKDQSYTCCHLEAEGNEVDTRCIYKIRLQFPYCNVNKDVARNLIFPTLIGALREFQFDLEQNILKDWKNVLNFEIYDSPITMLGSVRKKEEILEFKQVYGRITETGMESYNPKTYRLNEVFNPSNHMFVIRDYIDPECFKEHSLEHWLPLFLSLEYSEKVCHLLREPKKMKPKEEDIVKMMGDIENKELNDCHNFIMMWKQERLLNYNDWLKIGEALYNATKNAIGCERWIHITENILQRTSKANTPKFLIDEYGSIDVDEICMSHYYIFPENRITWKTLAKFASMDSPGRFKKWHNAWVREQFRRCDECNESDVAEIFCRMYPFEFIAIYESRTPTVYQYINHRWIKSPSPYSLRVKLKNKFAETIRALYEEAKIKRKREKDEDEQAALIKTEELYKEIYSNLKKKQFKNNLVQEICDNIAHRELLEHMDMDPELLGVKNGVLVATKDSVVFRKGIPEDYISYCTNVPYLPTLSWKSKSVKVVREWIRKIFLDAETEHHFLKFLSSLIRGGNIDKKLGFLVGEFGGNSKSAFIRFLIKTLGRNYAIKLPIAILTMRSRNANGPTPAIARGRVARLAVLDEADEQCDIHGSLMKMYTGGDSIFARFLNKNGGDMVLMCQLLVVCNIPPNIKNAGPAEIKRTLLYPFETMWVDPSEVPDTVEEQEKQRKFLEDRYFDENVKRCTIALLWIMKEYYHHYVEEGLHNIPDVMKKKSEDYWAQNDIYAQFTRENFEVLTDVTDSTNEADSKLTYSGIEYVNFKDVYKRFKTWYKSSYPEARMISSRVVRNHLCISWGKPEYDISLGGDIWFGFNFLDEDEEDGEDTLRRR